MRIAIIYWSGTGNTESMATLIAEGAREHGAEVEVLPVSQCDADILTRYDRFAFGCPSMGEEELEDMEFDPFFSGIEAGLAGKHVALFGSYGWGDGQWMRDWEQRTIANGAILFGAGLVIQDDPSSEADDCRAFGSRFSSV
jgi:flavodoxin short chain